MSLNSYIRLFMLGLAYISGVGIFSWENPWAQALALLGVVFAACTIIATWTDS